MLLQSTFIQSPLHQHVSLSSTSSHPFSIPFGFRGSTLVRTITMHNHPVITCSISQVHSYGTVDYERRPPVKWNSVYKKISMMENPELGSATVLNQYENDGKRLTKWELCRIVKELRKFKRYKLALEVYEWMNNRGDRFRMSTSDTAIQLDLIAKVRGISNAEDYFLNLPDTLMDKRTYGALLNAYVHGRVREKAESLLDKMRSKGYATHPLPFNVMMTLYMNLKHYDKVDSLISEMMEKKIPLDIYSYNIWLSCRGSLGSVEKMEQVFEQMKLNRTINPNWTTFSTMATMYLKLGLLGKAEECLKNVESRITGRDRIPYHYLISLYGGIGNKEEVHRVWNIYKSVFPNIPNLGYHAVISSLARLDDIEGAEKIFDDWLSIKTTYDPRIVNILMSYYVKKGFLENAEALFKQMVEMGGKPNSSTWEILAEGHIRERRISEALSCLKEATSAERSKNWKPKPANMTSLLKLCEQEADTASREVVVGILRQMGCFEDEAYMSYIPISNRVPNGEELLAEKGKIDNDDDSNISDGAEMLLNQLQGSL
ncbi:pentatricopeptide repeat-containing protein At1g02150 [Cornus florida]|uniref:pentatricopeptide repeat-containing protein At1g02150 n=1 Tax=Cornus florida TaxID=4283 RepID=UPI0028A260AC|nr:pentatricopeptide repeat-containing protein At1g02150 [Cornus florida]